MSTANVSRRRGRGVLIAVGALAIALVSVALFAVSGRVRTLSRGWAALASALPVSAFSATSSLAADAGAANGDGGKLTPRRQTSPLSSAQIGAPLVHGTFVTACGAPDTMKVVVKATIKMGRATNVNVKTDPPNSAVMSCVEHAARDFQWDISPKVAHVTVTY